MSRIKTIKLNSVPEPQRAAIKKFADKYNYVTVGYNHGTPHSMHYHWDKARDKVLDEYTVRLFIVDCTGTENVHSRPQIECGTDAAQIPNHETETGIH